MHIPSIRTRQGFTLVELVIAMTIIAVLATLAYPSYVGHVRRGQRAAAGAVLMEASHYLQQFHSVHHRYDRTISGEGVSLPDGLTRSPSHGATLYVIRLSERHLSRSTFVLEAVPMGTMARDHCGVLTLSSSGQRGIEGGSATVEDCWR